MQVSIIEKIEYEACPWQVIQLENIDTKRCGKHQSHESMNEQIIVVMSQEIKNLWIVG